MNRSPLGKKSGKNRGGAWYIGAGLSKNLICCEKRVFCSFVLQTQDAIKLFLRYFLVVCPGENHLTSLSLGFLIRKT